MWKDKPKWHNQVVNALSYKEIMVMLYMVSWVESMPLDQICEAISKDTTYGGSYNRSMMVL